VVGDGPLASEVLAEVRTLGIEDRVVMLGYLQGPAMEATYAAATVFVLPTWWIEGFPTVIAEAMHAGLPIVTTAMRGMADHLEHETNALFVPPRDPMALAGALLRLLTDHRLRTTMGAANREALGRFSPAIVGREYLAVLQSVAGGGGAACR
jgi:glycosyltransferase involved in cell wall biosynthesis